MIYVSKEQMAQVEYLIQQSIQGNHILFDPQDIYRAFGKSIADMTDADAYAVEHHIERMISSPTLAQKRAYLENLAPETRWMVVRTYFNIVENNLLEVKEVRH